MAHDNIIDLIGRRGGESSAFARFHRAIVREEIGKETLVIDVLVPEDLRKFPDDIRQGMIEFVAKALTGTPTLPNDVLPDPSICYDNPGEPTLRLTLTSHSRIRILDADRRSDLTFEPVHPQGQGVSL